MPTYLYQCLVADQRTGPDVPRFCTFFAPAGEVLEWSVVEPIQDQGPGFQRLVNPSRIRGVKRFFDQDQRNTIPTAIILTLRVPDDAFQPTGDQINKQVTISIAENATDAQKPGLIIDGQHRLLGANAFSPNTLVPIVALLNSSDLETAFQFLVINNKSARVPRDHIRKLALNYNAEGLEQRLRTARRSLKKNYALVGQVDEEEGSPFRHLIRWPTPAAEGRPVVPAAVEGALQYIQDQQLPPIKEDTDALLEFFYSLWTPVKEEWGQVWSNPNANLLSKVGVICLTQCLTDSLARKYEWREIDLVDPEQVKRQVRSLLHNNLVPDFWSQPWKEGGLDTKAGRQLIVEDLSRIALNRRADLQWFENLLTVGRPERNQADE